MLGRRFGFAAIMFSPYDYSDAPPPRDIELIPHGTILTLILHIRAGGVGEDGLLKRSKDGTCEMLDVEFTVADGPHKGRKFWEYLILEGTTDGHAKSKEINLGTLKTILDSALGLHPDDKSPQARAARTVSLKQFEGMTFIGKVGIEKGKPKNDGNASKETRLLKVSALVFIGDAMEESPDTVLSTANTLGQLSVPVFMFQEGRDPLVEKTFQDIARLTHGAYCRFDPGAARQLAELLKAVAVFATGGLTALANQHNASAVKLLRQLR